MIFGTFLQYLTVDHYFNDLHKISSRKIEGALSENHEHIWVSDTTKFSQMDRVQNPNQSKQSNKNKKDSNKTFKDSI